MTLTYINSVVTSSQTLDGNDQIFVLGSLQPSFGNGINFSNNYNTATISGSILGNSQGMQISGSNHVVRVTETGLISQTSSTQGGSAVYMQTGDNLQLINAGEIYGSFTVYFEGGTKNVLHNTGLISSHYSDADSSNGAVMNFSTDADIVNSGQIVARSAGISLREGTATVLNSGEITGRIGINIQDDTENVVKNTGTIIGLDGVAIEDGNNAFILRNFGLIEGTVVMGEGDDTYLGRSAGVVTAGVYGGADNDLLVGGSDADDLYGGSGADTVRGADGDDNLVGGNGHDEVRGGRGDDSLFGGNGKDVLKGGRGDDVLQGGDLRDTFHFNRRAGEDTVTDFENNVDRLDLSAFNVNNFNQLSNSGAIIRDGSGSQINLDDIGGDGVIYVDGMGVSDWTASDFIF